MAEIEIKHLPLSSLRPYARNARTHSPKQIAQIAASIREFGFNTPILIDRDGEIIACLSPLKLGHHVAIHERSERWLASGIPTRIF